MYPASFLLCVAIKLNSFPSIHIFNMAYIEDEDNPDNPLRRLLRSNGWCVIDDLHEDPDMQELEVAAYRQVRGRKGRDDFQRLWKAVFQKFKGANRQPDMGDNRRLMRSCGDAVETIVTRLIGRVQDKLGFNPRLSLHAPNFLGRLDGCAVQAYHRDAEFSGVFFVIISLCDNYTNYVIDRSQ